MKDTLKLVVTLTIIAAGAGAVLSLVESVTREPIAYQRRLETLKALKAVMPPIENEPDRDTVDLVTGRDKKGKDQVRTFYRGRRAGELAGVAFKVVAPDGYSGNIEIMVGIDPSGIISGMEILSHAETPGLGSKITEDWFKELFRGKGLEGTDWRVKKDGGQFDQITGATISPRAVVGAIRGGLEFYKKNRDEIATAVSGGKG